MTQHDYYVYAFELNDEPDYVYVGQSVHPPEVRQEQHKRGYKSARSIKYCTIGKLRPDLYDHYNPLATRAEAEAMESRLADDLRAKGFHVEGGHQESLGAQEDLDHDRRLTGLLTRSSSRAAARSVGFAPACHSRIIISMKTSQRATKKPLVVVLVAIIIITLITVGMIVLNQTNGIKSGRQQFYVVSGGIGGRCSHYLANSKGERQSTCVDSKLATWPLPRIDTDPTQELGAGTTSAAAVRAVRVDANVTVTTEQRSIPLPKPDYKKTRVIYIDDVLSAEVVTLP